MKRNYLDFAQFVILTVLFSITFQSCCKEDATVPSDTIAETAVDLVALPVVLRTREAELGNLISDAVVDYAKGINLNPDFAAINAGGIRFNMETLPDGVYPKGPITNERVDEMLPFGNTIVQVVLTGRQLKEILERSVSEIDNQRGQFLQISSGLHVVYDLSKQKQILDDISEPNVISVPGERVVSISISGNPLIDTAYYTGLFDNFLVEGNDGYVTFLTVDKSRITSLDFLFVDALKEFMILNSPVNPQIEGRISFQ